MKTRILAGAVCGVFLMAAGAMAQGYGLPVVESAEPRDQNFFDVTVGANVGQDTQYYGARDMFAVQKGLRFAIDLGLVSPEEGDNDLAAQGSMLVCLNVDCPVALGMRAAIYGMNGNAFDVLGGNTMLMASQELIFEGLFLYTGLGIDFRSTKTHLDAAAAEGVEAGKDSTDEKVSALWSLGALMPMTEHLWFFTELTVTDDTFIGAGIRIH
jgi:hypothetical protein